MSDIKISRKPIKISDTLIKKVARYDSVAFEELYNLSSVAVYGLAMSILGSRSDAEDVVQDTFISIYQNASKYNSKGKAMAWIFTITRNMALMKIRDRKKRSYVNLDNVYDLGVTDNIESNIHKEKIVNQLLNVLKDDDRQIVVMHIMSGLKHREIAKILDIKLSTVLSKYKRSLEKMRTEIEVNDYAR
jgi:RNA polymerase sigma-70 factor (ECF subfamily)